MYANQVTYQNIALLQSYHIGHMFSLYEAEDDREFIEETRNTNVIKYN